MKNVSPLLKLWLLVVVVALAWQLGDYPLLDADEGRNAEVAREMAATNQYVVPRLNTLPYLDKPVVYFAAEAALMELLGPTEVAARLPAYLFTLATAMVIFLFAKRVWGDLSPEVPWIAAIVFLSMPLTIAFARTVIFDSALAFFITTSIAAFYLAIEQDDARWSALAWASMGLAMITKGPVTFILVLIPAIVWGIRRKRVGRVFSILGIVLFAAVVAPWVWGVSKVVPEFLRYVLVTETVERMATGALKRTGPPWYFVPYLIGGALPFIVIAIFSWKSIRAAMRSERTTRFLADPTVYLLLTIAIPFVFFSLSQSKRPQYIVPLMAPLALVVARIWRDARTRATAIVVLALGLVLVAAPFVLDRTKMKPELIAPSRQTAAILGAAMLAGGAVALFSRRQELQLAAFSLPMIAFPIAATPLLQAIAESRSTRAFVAEISPYVTPETTIVGVEAYSGSMSFYLGKPIVVVSEDGSELTSNYLLRRFDRFSANPAAPLRKLPYFEQSLADCCSSRVYVVRDDDAKRQAQLEAHGWKKVADDARHAGYAKGSPIAQKR